MHPAACHFTPPHHPPVRTPPHRTAPNPSTRPLRRFHFAVKRRSLDGLQRDSASVTPTQEDSEEALYQDLEEEEELYSELIH